MGPAGEESVGSAGERGRSISAPSLGKAKPGRERLWPTYFICCGEKIDTREVARFSCLLDLLHESPVWFFDLP